ncbi:hypothetical protein P775_14205 [Puniceibacterium antarcticum]|uniref:Uncharacterized protein n=1 Tax=Puniceibacterium antarcticum TaxID=1206336 RepID=A0A2G8RD73_9RHOB|nr:hypothetical protein [Puniceibacterium antarcticum]PIL19525.1 hypothetical protein P775_14205 [Puniceibacterium antarcticum]
MQLTDMPSYPRLAIGPNLPEAEQIEALMTVTLVDEVARHAELTETDGAREALKVGMVESCNAYLRGAWDRENQRPESQDNQALWRVSQAAQTLYDTLLDLQSYPGVEPQLERTIDEYNGLYALAAGTDLSKLTGTRQNIFHEFREILVDLQICAENTANLQPKPQILEAIEGDEKPIRVDTDEKLLERRSEWRKRTKTRKFPKDHAAQEFLRQFRKTWKRLSPHPFTEGMYYGETGQTVSRLVDASHTVLKAIEPGVTRQSIVNSVRKMRDSAT